jgi:hypothetical protein
MTTALPALAHRDTFERNVIAAMLAGAIAGLAHDLIATVAAIFGGGFAPFPAHEVLQPVSIGAMAVAATVLASARGDRTDRWLLSGCALLPFAPYVLGAEGVWKPLLAGAIAGPLMVRAHLCDRGVSGTVGAERPGRLNFLFAAGLTALFAAAGVAVARILGDALGASAAPIWLSCALGGGAIALFTALGAIAGHVGLSGDPALARLSTVAQTARDTEVQRLVERAGTAYRASSELIAGLPKEPAREALAETLSELANDAAERAERWIELAPHVEGARPEEIDSELARLSAQASAARDPIARRQLEIAGEALRLERSRLSDLTARRERLLAKLEANVALLGSARMSLLQARSSRAQLGPSDLQPITQRLTSLLRVERDATQLADAQAAESVVLMNGVAGHGERSEGESNHHSAPSAVLAPTSLKSH